MLRVGSSFKAIYRPGKYREGSWQSSRAEPNRTDATQDKGESAWTVVLRAERREARAGVWPRARLHRGGTGVGYRHLEADRFAGNR